MLMCMGTMTRRLQILMDDDRYALLERESAASGRSVAELIREAVDHRYRADPDARRDAYQRILAAEPMPVDDWDVMKSELLEAFEGHDPS